MSSPRTPLCRTLRLYVTLALLAIGRFADPAYAALRPAPPTRPFRAQDWDLAWQAFVGAGAVDDAFSLARTAVKARPRSRLWLERLAQAARWSNHPRTALATLSRLALELHETRDLRPAFDLAVGLGSEGRAIALLREMIRTGQATAAQRRMLSGLYLNAGEPARAISELQREFAHRPDRRLLWEQAVIYRTMGDPVRELATLRRYRRRFGPGAKVMLATATIDYVQGHLQRALKALLAARSRARPSDTAYWQTLSGLAWLLGRYRLAAGAAKVLIGTGKADASSYLRVVYAEQYRDPRQAFAIAERGWKRWHEPALFLSMLDLASSAHPSTPWLQRAFAELSPAEAAAFADTPAYWISLAELRSAEGRHRAALAAYRQALTHDPHDASLLASYLWLLVDTGDLAPIAPRLYRLARRARRAPQLWAPLAAAYAGLHQPGRALPWLEAAWPARRNDPEWLIDYADTLEQAGHPDAAWRLRRRAYALLTRDDAHQAGAQGIERRKLALARLAFTLAPGDPARRAIEALAQQPARRQARLTVLTALQGEQAYGLAHWWRLRAFRRDPPPRWSLLSQALADHDGPAMSSLLEREGARLAPRDRVSAARDLGWDSKALSLAYQGLEDEPRDAALYGQFKDLAVPRADSLGAALGATQISGLLDEGVNLEARHWLSGRDRLEIRIDTLHQRTTDLTQLGTPPSLSRAARLTWRHVLRSGSLTLELGAGRNLAAWSREGIEWRRRWSGALRTSVAVLSGARPLDTAALSVAGLEQRVEASASEQLTPRADLQLRLEAGRLLAQGGGALGQVQRFSLGTDYRLWFSPPDFTLDASLSGAHYAHAARLPAQLLPLVPADQKPTVDFFVPASFVQACAGGHFNMRYETGYARQLRPYASADLCANSVSGQGYDLTTGIAMPVSAADHLSLTLNLENDVGTHSGRTAGVILRYRHYFTPTQ